MVLTNYYLRVTPFTNPDVADKLQLKALKRSQPFMSTIQPLFFYRYNLNPSHYPNQNICSLDYLNADI
jgi:hypothetical protein